MIRAPSLATLGRSVKIELAASTVSRTHPDPFNLRPALLTGSAQHVLKALGRLPNGVGVGTLADEYAFAPPPGKRWYPGTQYVHHARVISNLHLHFAQTPEGADRALLTLTAALHDVGKRSSMTALLMHAKRDPQKTYTLRLVDLIRPQLPLEEPAFNRMRALISSNVHGPLFQDHVSVSRAAAITRKGAEAANMEPAKFLRLLTALNQSDVAAYTLPAGGPELLDHVFARSPNGAFVRHQTENRLRYNISNEQKLAALHKAIETFGTRSKRTARAASTPVPR